MDNMFHDDLFQNDKQMLEFETASQAFDLLGKIPIVMNHISGRPVPASVYAFMQETVEFIQKYHALQDMEN